VRHGKELPMSGRECDAFRIKQCSDSFALKFTIRHEVTSHKDVKLYPDFILVCVVISVGQEICLQCCKAIHTLCVL